MSVPVGSSSTTPDEGGECWCTHPSHVGPCRVMVDLGTLSARLCLCGGPAPLGPRVVVGHPNEADDEGRDWTGIAAVKAEEHQPDLKRGGCTCGFCAFSTEHAVVMVARDLRRLADAEQSELRTELREVEQANRTNVTWQMAESKRANAAEGRLAAIQALPLVDDMQWAHLSSRDAANRMAGYNEAILYAQASAGGVVDG